MVRDNLETLFGAIDDGGLAVRIPRHAREELLAYLHQHVQNIRGRRSEPAMREVQLIAQDQVHEARGARFRSWRHRLLEYLTSPAP